MLIDKKVLQARKARLLAEAEAQIDNEMAELERLAEKLGFSLVESDLPAGAPHDISPSRVQRTPFSFAGTSPKSASATARARAESEAVIAELGHPVPLKELWERIEARGVSLGGERPSWQLSSILGKAPNMVRTERGWWLKGRPVPPINGASGGE